MKQTKIPEIKIVSRDFKATEPIKEKIKESLNRSFKKTNNIKQATITLKKVKGSYGAEILLHTRGPIIKVSSVSNDIYTSMDEAFDKLKNQVSKYSKREERAQKRHTLRYAPYSNPNLEIKLEEIFGTILPLELKKKKKQYSICEKILSKNEALCELKKTKKKYLIYIDSESMKKTYITASLSFPENSF